MKDRVLPLAVTTLIVFGAWLYFHETGQRIDQDRWLGILLTVGLSLVPVRMILETERWGVQGLAVLVAFVGLGSFFGDLTLRLWGVEVGAWNSALYRSCFVVVAPTFIVLFVLWAARFCRRRLRRRREVNGEQTS